MYDTLFFIDRRRIGGGLIFLENTGVAHPHLKKLWYPDGQVDQNGVVAPTIPSAQLLEEKIAGTLGGIIRDRFLAAQGYYFYWDPETETYKKMFQEGSFASPVEPMGSVPVWPAGHPANALAIRRKYRIDIKEDVWRNMLLDNPAFESTEAARDILNQIDGGGWPYLKKYFITGFQADDFILNPLGLDQEMAPLISEQWLNLYGQSYEDYTTTFDIPLIVEDNTTTTAAYTANISTEYNHYESAFEDNFVAAGLQETAMPNYYMMYYPLPEGASDLPDAYYKQITLNGNVNWIGSLIGMGEVIDPLQVDPGGGEYYAEFNAALSAITAALETSDGQGALDSINSFMNDRYKNICIRPRSMGVLDNVDNEGNPYYNRLPSYVKIEISLHGADGQPSNVAQSVVDYISGVGSYVESTNLFREAVKDVGLWDHFITNLIRVDIEGLVNDQLTVPDIQGRGGPPNLIALETLITRNQADPVAPVPIRSVTGNGMLKNTSVPSTKKWTMDPYYNWLEPWREMLGSDETPGLPATEWFESVYNTEQIEYIREPSSITAARGTYLIDPSFFVDPAQISVYGFTSLENSDPVDIHGLLSDLRMDYLRGGEELMKNLMRNIEEYNSGEGCYSETLMFKIEKRKVPADLLSILPEDLDAYPPIQTIYIPNDNNDNYIEYIDSQVIYGVRYQYDIKTIKLVVGSQVNYADTRTPGQTGVGKAVGNALGIYKETEQNLVLPNLQPPNSYVPEDQDTNFAATHTGRFIFKSPNPEDQPISTMLNYQSINFDDVNIVIQDGNGVNNNIDGGALSNSANWPAPLLYGRELAGAVGAGKTGQGPWAQADDTDDYAWPGDEGEEDGDSSRRPGHPTRPLGGPSAQAPMAIGCSGPEFAEWLATEVLPALPQGPSTLGLFSWQTGQIDWADWGITAVTTGVESGDLWFSFSMAGGPNEQYSWLVPWETATHGNFRFAGTLYDLISQPPSIQADYTWTSQWGEEFAMDYTPEGGAWPGTEISWGSPDYSNQIGHRTPASEVRRIFANIYAFITGCTGFSFPADIATQVDLSPQSSVWDPYL